jgi:mono/diheme cytochrome c family protein
MGKAILLSALAVVFVVGCSKAGKKEMTAEEQVERGRYLVENVGMCADCHTPMNERGEPVRESWLQGAPLSFKPLFEVPNWADVALPIAGLPNISEKDAISVLETGVYGDNQTLRPPMPQFRFKHEDAVAVVAYLKSLKSE